MTDATPADTALVAELEALLATSRQQRAALRSLLVVVLERVAAAPPEVLRG